MSTISSWLALILARLPLGNFSVGQSCMSGNLSYSGFARSTYDQLMINNGSVGVMLCDQQVITSCAGLERSMCDPGGDQDGFLPIGAFFLLIMLGSFKTVQIMTKKEKKMKWRLKRRRGLKIAAFLSLTSHPCHRTGRCIICTLYIDLFCTTCTVYILIIN